MAEPRELCRAPQSGLRERILIVVVREASRTPQHRTGDVDVEVPTRTLTHGPQERRDQLLDGHGLFGDTRCGEGSRRQMALDGANQATTEAVGHQGLDRRDSEGALARAREVERAAQRRGVAGIRVEPEPARTRAPGAAAASNELLVPKSMAKNVGFGMGPLNWQQHVPALARAFDGGLAKRKQ